MLLNILPMTGLQSTNASPSLQPIVACFLGKLYTLDSILYTVFYAKSGRSGVSCQLAP